jgi:hypothetical protein
MTPNRPEVVVKSNRKGSMIIGPRRVGLTILLEHWAVFFISKNNGSIATEPLAEQTQRLSRNVRSSI